MKPKPRELGRNVATCRRAVGLTQELLAERAGVNVKTVQGVEQGRTQPALRTLTLLAQALDVPLESLIPRGRAGSTDAIIKRIAADLRRLPPSLLGHLAAVVHALAMNRK